MKRITQIEGLRAYLALWVLIDHVMMFSGYSFKDLNGIFKIVRSGWYAVDIFIIISGFVVFYLLDNKKERYLKYITRRFFRLYPLFIILFIISIPLASIRLSNAKEFVLLYPTAEFGNVIIIINSWFENIWLHILVHIPMLHGLVPQTVLPYAPSAFLGTSWSISLEWQFYLIAPFIFNYLSNTLKKYRIEYISIIVVLLFFLSNYLPFVQFGAFLPMHIEYFYIGWISYFIYKKLSEIKFEIYAFPIGLTMSLLIYFNSNSLEVLPICLWIAFFCFIIDANIYNRKYTNIISRIFDTWLVQYLGKISYSIYLSHFLVIFIIQKYLIDFLPNISQKNHLIYLGISTFIITIIVSGLLFRFIEKPGVIIGKKLLKKTWISKN